MSENVRLKKVPAKTHAEYIRRINMALEYIEQHLEQTISLDDVASASCFSAYHFHRIFHAMLGETVNEYISRKRLEHAIRLLMYRPGLSITDIAEAGGFSSGANFSRAFKLYFGISPSAIRNPDSHEISKTGKLYSKYGKVIRPRDFYSQFVTNNKVFDSDKLEELLMKIKIDELAEKQIAYLTSPGGYKLESVYKTWDKVSQWAVSHGVEDNLINKFAICHDNPMITPEEKCRYDAAIVIDNDIEVLAPFKKTSIPQGKYAVAYFNDSADKINHFMTEFCSNWFCSSGYEPDDYPPMFNYLDDSKEDNIVEMDVYIKLKELKV